MIDSSSIHSKQKHSHFSWTFSNNAWLRSKRFLQNWFDSIEIKNPRVARLICRLVPAGCPFERDIKFFGRILFHIPPLCHLNPFYDEFVALRFRALVFLEELKIGT